MFILNDPYRGAIHQPDVSIVMPIFHAGRRIAWTGACAHVRTLGIVSHAERDLRYRNPHHDGTCRCGHAFSATQQPCVCRVASADVRDRRNWRIEKKASGRLAAQWRLASVVAHAGVLWRRRQPESDDPCADELHRNRDRHFGSDPAHDADSAYSSVDNRLFGWGLEPCLHGLE